MTPPPAAYLVRGEDPALVSDAARRVVAGALGGLDPSLAVEDFGAEAGDDQRVVAVLDACLTPPLLTERRVVVVRDAGTLSADDGRRLAAYLDEPLESTVLVLVGGGGTVPAALVVAVKKHGQVVEAGPPRGARDRGTWLAERVAAGPVALDKAALAGLGRHLGEDLGRLGGILDTLAAAYGHGARLGPADIEPYLGEAGGVAPWDLTDAVDKGDDAAALAALHRLVKAGERHPLAVLATLHRHYAAMLRLDGAGATGEADAARLLGMKGPGTFAAAKALRQAGRLGSGRIRRAVALLASADLDLRGASAWPPDLVVEVLVARLCQLSRR